MKSLYFIRHGESEFNRADKLAGTSDTPLTDTGHEQAKETGKALKNQGLAFDIIISSPLERAHHTAKHVASQIDYPHDRIVIHDNLVERNFGVFEGDKEMVANTDYARSETAIDDYDGVESLEDLQSRARDFLDYLHTLDYDQILVVGHGAFARALRREINKEPMEYRGKPLSNAELVRLI